MFVRCTSDSNRKTNRIGFLCCRHILRKLMLIPKLMVWNIHQRFKYDYLMLCWVSILNFRGVVVVFQCQCHSTPPSDWTPATSEVSGGFAWGGMQHLLGWSLRRSNFSKSINGCLVYTSQTTHLRNITLYKVKLPLCSNPFCKWFERGCWVTPSLTWYLEH